MREEGREVTEEAINQRLAHIYADARETVSAAQFDRDAFDDATVISAEEVAAYWMSIPQGTTLVELIDVLAPPYERLFVEFQHQPNQREIDLNSWGVLFDAVRIEDVLKDQPGLAPGWIVQAQLVFEFHKGEPVGPVAGWSIPLDERGRATRGGETVDGVIFPTRTEFEGGSPWGDVQPEHVLEPATEFAASHLGPALFAISLMHCKNVDVRTVDPPERLSRKHQRKHGRPLTRYHILDIVAMRRILDYEGEAQTKGLRHALHICRGHFKTFSEDAPLFGRHVGTYWWPAQVRGSAAEGRVEKDYAIRLDGGAFGVDYREADEEVSVAPADVKPDDPDTSQRGRRAHNRTQNLLAAAVEAVGLSPRSSAGDEPDFDLAWRDGDTVWVAEVKSTTAMNEERQLRLAIGQVIRYRQKLSGGGADVRAMVAVENAPYDESWIDLCGREGIALVWPEVMAQALGDD